MQKVFLAHYSKEFVDKKVTMENTVKFFIVFFILFQPVVPIDSKYCNG